MADEEPTTDDLLDSLQKLVEELALAMQSETGKAARQALLGRAQEVIDRAEHFQLVVETDRSDVDEAIERSGMSQEPITDSTVRLVGEVALRVGVSAALGATISGPVVALVLHQEITDKAIEAVIGGAVGGMTNEITNRISLTRNSRELEGLEEAQSRIASLEKELERLGHDLSEHTREAGKSREAEKRQEPRQDGLEKVRSDLVKCRELMLELAKRQERAKADRERDIERDRERQIETERELDEPERD